MSYATNADIEQRLGGRAYVQLTDDEGTGTASESRVTEAREAAEGEVNSYLARRYATPVDVAGHPELAALLKSITLDWAEYRLHARRPPVPDEVCARREASRGWLAAISTGALLLPSSNMLAESDLSGLRARATGSARVLSRSEMADL